MSEHFSGEVYVFESLIDFNLVLVFVADNTSYSRMAVIDAESGSQDTIGVANNTATLICVISS